MWQRCQVPPAHLKLAVLAHLSHEGIVRVSKLKVLVNSPKTSRCASVCSRFVQRSSRAQQVCVYMCVWGGAERLTVWASAGGAYVCNDDKSALTVHINSC